MYYTLWCAHFSSRVNYGDPLDPVDQQKEAAHMRQMTLTIIFLALVGCSTEMQRLTAQREAPATFVFELRNDGEGTCTIQW